MVLGALVSAVFLPLPAASAADAPDLIPRDLLFGNPERFRGRISPDGSRLYVCNRFTNDVSVIDLAAGKELARVPAVREPIAAAVTPDGKSVFVANHLPHVRTHAIFVNQVAAVVTVIDAQTTRVELNDGNLLMPTYTRKLK